MHFNITGRLSSGPVEEELEAVGEDPEDVSIDMGTYSRCVVGIADEYLNDSLSSVLLPLISVCVMAREPPKLSKLGSSPEIEVS